MSLFSAKIDKNNSFIDDNYESIKPQFRYAVKFLNCFFNEARDTGYLSIEENVRSELVDILANERWRSAYLNLGLCKDEKALLIRRLDKRLRRTDECKYSAHFLIDRISILRNAESIGQFGFPLGQDNIPELSKKLRENLIAALIEVFDSGDHSIFEVFFETLLFDKSFLHDFEQTDKNLRSNFISDAIKLDGIIRSSYASINIKCLQDKFANNTVTDDSDTNINKHRKALTANLYGNLILCSWHFKYGNSGRAYLGKIPNGLAGNRKLIFKRWGHI